ncbi:MAG: phospholipid/cholesterol/gamma-HCH transport system substrate-binding protein, partial [Mycobacterium sp.]|nr:phospholipid/cholesterol/gamma-HCH transport system substrate-binding protein [Mycobacterium sp.]
MSTIFNVRNLKLPALSRASIIVGTIVVILGLIVASVGWHLYKKLTTNTVVAYFPQTLALYPGDKVQIMGVRVGTIDSIEPAGDKMKVTFTYSSKYKVPANVTASILNPSLVASRTIQLAPPYTGGPELEDEAVIPIDRTQVPVEYDELRDSINRILTDLGPTPAQPKGPFGDVIESFADGLAGKGKEINTTLNSLSEELTTLNQGRGDFFGVVKSLALFVNALYKSDQQFVALNHDLAQFTNSFTNTDREVATALKDLDQLLTTTRGFLDENASVLTKDVNNLADVTNAILQPTPRDGLETGLHVFPNLAANIVNISSPNAGGIVGLPTINMYANPMQFLCSAIQAGSRLGYQDSAELCAQYLAPILDATKFNYPPFGLNQFSSAMTLPKQVAYSEPRLQPPPGYKDTTVPGIFSRDTLFSHGNHEPGWVVAPGMQGVDVQPLTQNMLTPESLSELMGGPDIVAPPAPPAFGVQP